MQRIAIIVLVLAVWPSAVSAVHPPLWQYVYSIGVQTISCGLFLLVELISYIIARAKTKSV